MLQTFLIKKAIQGITAGSSIHVGGFGLCGIPENSINEIARNPQINNLTCISNDGGTEDFGLGLLMRNKQISKMIGSFLGYNRIYEQLYLSGEIDVELCPQGTLAERIRSAGAGIPAFYTATGVGTFVSEGGLPIRHNKAHEVTKISEKNEVRQFNGRNYVLMTALKADFALIKGWKADTHGNVIFRKTANNFNCDMAKAAKVTICEVEEIVPAGKLDPNFIHLPGIYVNRLFKGSFEKRIERPTTTEQNQQMKTRN